VLIFSGRNEVSPPNMRLPDLALRVLHEQPALRALHEDDGDGSPPTTGNHEQQRPPLICARSWASAKACRI
jgi:hypothetical protein